jgi:hypothetical protein
MSANQSNIIRKGNPFTCALRSTPLARQMTTIPTPVLAHQPVMPVPIPSYAYRYPNSDSKPYAVLPDRTGIYNKTLPGTYQWESHNPDIRDNLTYLGPVAFKAPPRQYALAPNYPRENYGPTVFSRIVISNRSVSPPLSLSLFLRFILTGLQFQGHWTGQELVGNGLRPSLHQVGDQSQVSPGRLMLTLSIQAKPTRSGTSSWTRHPKDF